MYTNGQLTLTFSEVNDSWIKILRCK